MIVILNGEQKNVDDSATLSDVIESVTEVMTGIAVAVDEQVVPKHSWPNTPLRGCSRIEVLTAVQGG